MAGSSSAATPPPNQATQATQSSQASQTSQVPHAAQSLQAKKTTTVAPKKRRNRRKKNNVIDEEAEREERELRMKIAQSLHHQHAQRTEVEAEDPRSFALARGSMDGSTGAAASGTQTKTMGGAPQVQYGGENFNLNAQHFGQWGEGESFNQGNRNTNDNGGNISPMPFDNNRIGGEMVGDEAYAAEIVRQQQMEIQQRQQWHPSEQLQQPFHPNHSRPPSSQYQYEHMNKKNDAQFSNDRMMRPLGFDQQRFINMQQPGQRVMEGSYNPNPVPNSQHPNMPPSFAQRQTPPALQQHPQMLPQGYPPPGQTSSHLHHQQPTQYGAQAHMSHMQLRSRQLHSSTPPNSAPSEPQSRGVPETPPTSNTTTTTPNPTTGNESLLKPPLFDHTDELRSGAKGETGGNHLMRQQDQRHQQYQQHQQHYNHNQHQQPRSLQLPTNSREDEFYQRTFGNPTSLQSPLGNDNETGPKYGSNSRNPSDLSSTRSSIASSSRYSLTPDMLAASISSNENGLMFHSVENMSASFSSVIEPQPASTQRDNSFTDGNNEPSTSNLTSKVPVDVVLGSVEEEDEKDVSLAGNSGNKAQKNNETSVSEANAADNSYSEANAADNSYSEANATDNSFSAVHAAPTADSSNGEDEGASDNDTDSNNNNHTYYETTVNLPPILEDGSINSADKSEMSCSQKRGSTRQSLLISALAGAGEPDQANSSFSNSRKFSGTSNFSSIKSCDLMSMDSFTFETWTKLSSMEMNFSLSDLLECEENSISSSANDQKPPPQSEAQVDKDEKPTNSTAASADYQTSSSSSGNRRQAQQKSSTPSRRLSSASSVTMDDANYRRHSRGSRGSASSGRRSRASKTTTSKQSVMSDISQWTMSNPFGNGSASSNLTSINLNLGPDHLQHDATEQAMMAQGQEKQHEGTHAGPRSGAMAEIVRQQNYFEMEDLDDLSEGEHTYTSMSVMSSMTEGDLSHSLRALEVNSGEKDDAALS